MEDRAAAEAAKLKREQEEAKIIEQAKEEEKKERLKKLESQKESKRQSTPKVKHLVSRRKKLPLKINCGQIDMLQPISTNCVVIKDKSKS